MARIKQLRSKFVVVDVAGYQRDPPLLAALERPCVSPWLPAATAPP